jgi:succinate dehydrogenase / fumarate reductase cytochrome b subunit
MSDSVQPTARPPRPEYKNIGIDQILGSYRLPLAGKLSILHRVSGAGLFLLLPFLLYIFDLSITSEISFLTFTELIGSPLVKIILLGLIWAFLHHFCAGIRFLMLDLHRGIEKHQIQKSAMTVFIISLSLTAVFGAKLFNLF